MPHTNTWEEKGLYRKFSGEISGVEILQSNFESQSHPNFHKIKYVINDFLDINGYSVTTHHTKTYAMTDDVISNSKGKLKVALIADQEPLLELANSYQEAMQGKLFECKIFNTLEAARKWVAIE